MTTHNDEIWSRLAEHSVRIETSEEEIDRLRTITQQHSTTIAVHTEEIKRMSAEAKDTRAGVEANSRLLIAANLPEMTRAVEKMREQMTESRVDSRWLKKNLGWFVAAALVILEFVLRMAEKT